MTSISLRWLILAMASIGGAVGLLYLLAWSVLAPNVAAGVLGVGALIGGAAITRTADRPIIVEVALASSLVVVMMFLADRFLPGLDFVTNAGERSLPWMLAAALVTLAFSNLGARLGSRARPGLASPPVQRLIEPAFALSLVLAGGLFLQLVLVGLLSATGSMTLHTLALVSTFLVPTVSGLLFQSAHTHRLRPAVPILAPLFFSLPFLVAAVLSDSSDTVAIGTALFVGSLLAGGGCWLGVVIGTRFLAEPDRDVPQARASTSPRKPQE